MAVGKSNSNQRSSSSKKPGPAGAQVDVTAYQKLDSRQLNALLSQRKIELGDEVSEADKVRAVLDDHVANGDTLVGSGTLQVLPDGFGFLRSRWFNYLGGPDDIYVSPSQIRKFSLKNGDVVEGHIRPPKENERFFALLRVQSVNHLDPEDAAAAPNFEDLKSLAPDLRIELGDAEATSRIVDLIAPVGFGQRGIVVGPPRSGKTGIIEQLCRSMVAGSPKVYVFMLLVDQRPEEITRLESELNGNRCEVISSVFDDTSFRHNDVAMMVFEKAKRMVELGDDVVIFLDSLTSLARFELGPGIGPDQVEADALSATRSLLASARKTESAGSLTIIGTLTANSTNELDDAIAESLRGTANMEIRLDHELVKRRIWPAINVHMSQTQQEEVLLGDEYDAVCKLRRSIGDMSAPEAMDELLSKIEGSESNEEWLSQKS